MKFRIVRDDHRGGDGFEVQKRFFGIYRQLSENHLGAYGTNTSRSLEMAEEFIQKYCKHILEEKERRRAGKTVKVVKVDNKELLLWKLQGKI